MINFVFILLSNCYSSDLDGRPNDYVDVSSFEKRQEVIFDESGGVNFLEMKDTDQVNSEIIQETNQQLSKLEQDLRDLAEIQELMATQISQDGEKLDVAELQVETTLVQAIDTVEILKEAEKLQHQNVFLSLFLRGGVPLSAGASVGAAGFFATKAAVIGVAPVLATTAAPIIIPTVLALAVGGGTLVLSKFIMEKIV